MFYWKVKSKKSSSGRRKLTAALVVSATAVSYSVSILVVRAENNFANGGLLGNVLNGLSGGAMPIVPGGGSSSPASSPPAPSPVGGVVSSVGGAVGGITSVLPGAIGGAIPAGNVTGILTGNPVLTGVTGALPSVSSQLSSAGQTVRRVGSLLPGPIGERNATGSGRFSSNTPGNVPRRADFSETRLQSTNGNVPSQARPALWTAGPGQEVPGLKQVSQRVFESSQFTEKSNVRMGTGAQVETSAHGRYELKDGALLISTGAHDDCVVSTSAGKVWIGRQSDALVSVVDEVLRVQNLDSVSDSVRVALNSRSGDADHKVMAVRLGYELTAGNDKLGWQHIKPADSVGRRSQTLLENGTCLVSEIQLASLVSNHKVLAALRTSTVPADKQIYNRLLKNCAILNMTRGNHGFVAQAKDNSEDRSRTSASLSLTGVLKGVGDSVITVLDSQNNIPAVSVVRGTVAPLLSNPPALPSIPIPTPQVPPVVPPVPPGTPPVPPPATRVDSVNPTATASPSQTQTQSQTINPALSTAPIQAPLPPLHDSTPRPGVGRNPAELNPDELEPEMIRKPKKQNSDNNPPASSKVQDIQQTAALPVELVVHEQPAHQQLRPENGVLVIDTLDPGFMLGGLPAEAGNGNVVAPPPTAARSQNNIQESIASGMNTARQTVRKFPELFMGLCAAIAALLVLSVVQAAQSFKRARETEALNKQLEAQMVEREALEQKTQELNQDLQARVSELDELNQQLGVARDNALEASRLKSEFVANISHEIRTPISAVIGLNQLMLNTTKLNKEQREYATLINESAQSLLSVINDILDFSKIEAGKLEVVSLAFPLDSVMKQLADLMGPLVKSKGLLFTLFVDPSVSNTLRGDPARLRQVLVNLCGNAGEVYF